MDYSKEIDLSGIDMLFDAATVRAQMRQTVEAAMQHARGEITKLMPDGATGNLRRSMQAIAVETAEGIEGTVYIPETNPAIRYASVVEYGRAPGKPPPSKPGSDLYKWATRKYTTARYQATGRIQRKSPSREKAIYSFAIAVSKSIGKKGTKGQYPVQRGWAKAESQMANIIASGFERLMER